MGNFEPTQEERFAGLDPEMLYLTDKTMYREIQVPDSAPSNWVGPGEIEESYEFEGHFIQNLKCQELPPRERMKHQIFTELIWNMIEGEK